MMKHHTAMIVAFSSLGAAAATAIFAMNNAAGHYEWHPIYLWVVAPYALCILGLMLPLGLKWPRIVSGCVTALAMLIATFVFYVEGLLRSTSSTSPIIVIFAPMYLIAGSAVFWALAYVVFRKWIDIRKE